MILIKYTTLIFFVLLLASCSSSVRFAEKGSSNTPQSKQAAQNHNITESESINGRQSDVISEAEKWIGTPYCFGGESSNCIDCSGFVKKIFESAGIILPRTSTEQFEYGKAIDNKERKIGDLVFFKSKAGINHVGIYAGNNEFIHASTSLGVVRQSLDENYYKAHFAGYKRVM